MPKVDNLMNIIRKNINKNASNETAFSFVNIGFETCLHSTKFSPGNLTPLQL